MCGIAGIIGQGAAEKIKQELSTMLAATNHRGPDDQGTYINDDIAIGMNRLAIIDTTYAGHQPLFSQDERFVIVYNGEIYNFIQLRNELERKGFKFTSQSDTEVVLKSYIAYGVQMLQKIRGMFSFFIWDKKEKIGFAAKDQLGIKPLLYAVKNSQLYFCSELKGFLAIGEFVNCDICHSSLSSFLSLGHTIPPYTMLEGVKSLKSGHFLIWKNGEATEEQFWFPENIIPYNVTDISYEECVAKVKEITLQSIEEELMSDVPLGVFQSGGLDSCIITASMRIMGVREIETFSIGYEHSTNNIDERADAKAIADYYNTSHNEVVVSNQSVCDYFQDYIKGLDQPSADGYNTYLVSRYAAEKVTVALSGLGGDELFVGYYGFIQFLNRRKRFPFNLMTFLLDNKPISSVLPNKLYKVLFEEKSKKEDISTYISILQRNQDRFNNNLLNNNFNALNTHSSTAEIIRKNYKLPTDKLNKIKLLYLLQFMSNLNLRDSDAVAMKRSLEVRFPLIDVRLVEFALQIPHEYKTLNISGLGERTYGKDGLKRILKDAFAHDLPPFINSRKKRGFQLPNNIWFKGPLHDFIMDTVSDPCELLNKKSVESTYKKWKKCNQNWKELWSIFMLDQWYKQVYLSKNYQALNFAASTS